MGGRGRGIVLMRLFTFRSENYTPVSFCGLILVRGRMTSERLYVCVYSVVFVKMLGNPLFFSWDSTANQF